MATAKVWVWGHFSWAKARGAAGKEYQDWHSPASLLVRCLVSAAVTRTGAYFLILNVRRCFPGGTTLFVILQIIQLIGHEVHLTATKDKWAKYALSNDFALTGGGFDILATAGRSLCVFAILFSRFTSVIQKARLPEHKQHEQIARNHHSKRASKADPEINSLIQQDWQTYK